MKKIIVSIVFSLLLVVGILGQETPQNKLGGFIETEVEMASGEATPQVKANLTYGGKSKVGGYCWIQVKRAWQQFYCGPTYQPKSWLQVGAGIGTQSGSKRLQIGGFVWAGKSISGKFVQNFLAVEKVGKWFRNVTSVDLNKKFTSGVVTQRFQGTGPRVEYRLDQSWSIAAEAKFGTTSNFAFSAKYSF